MSVSLNLIINGLKILNFIIVAANDNIKELFAKHGTHGLLSTEMMGSCGDLTTQLR